MANTSAMGVSVRHAINRALATANLTPEDATFKVQHAQAWLTGARRVGRGEVTLSIAPPRPLTEWEPHELDGWVNPDGQHPMMVLVRLADPLFVDVTPVTWEAWLAYDRRTRLPERTDPACPRTGLSFDEATAYARSVGKRLPTPAEFRALWGEARFPWGEDTNPGLGRVEAPPYEPTPETGLLPPQRGLCDLGAWLWQWQSDGTLSGGTAGRHPGFDQPWSGQLDHVGLRCVSDP